MKTILTPILLAALAAATPTFAADEVAPPALAPATAGTNDGLRLNFRGVDLEQVLNYLSDAAGFIIVLDAKPRGKVDVWSNTPLTKDEAVDLLNSVLNKNGLASIRSGRTLTIIDKELARMRNVPVIQGGDPGKIPNNDEIVTQIIPVRFVEVGQLVKDLMPLVPTTSTMIPNESGNSILMTDTQANIRRVAEIIQAIDQSAEDVTEVEVFRLHYADPTEMATLLTSVFPDDSRSGGAQLPTRVGGGGRGGRGGTGGFGGAGGAGGLAALFGGAGGQTANGQNARIQKRARVIAVPDARTQSVIVSAASGLMAQIKDMVTQLDSNPAKKQQVYVYSLENADAQQVTQVLQEMFETTTTSSRNNNRNSQQNNPLTTRANQSQQSSTTTTGARTGNRGGTGGTGGGGGGGF